MKRERYERTDVGDFKQVTNKDFIDAVVKSPSGAYPALCVKEGNPEIGGWSAINYDESSLIKSSTNNYLSCASFSLAENGDFNVKKENFAAYHFIILDDVGTKIPLEKLPDIEPTWIIETSPGNYQVGFVLAEPITDISEAERLIKAVIDAGLSDKGAGGVSRWARLPNAINGKLKYEVDGESFQCRLVEWNPEQRYTMEQLADLFKLNLSRVQERTPEVFSNQSQEHTSSPGIPENCVITELKKRGLYKTPLGSGKHDISCPWVHEHTDALDTGAAYFEPDERLSTGGFCCQHSHREQYHIRELLDFLDIEEAQTTHKPLIKVVPGDLHHVVDAAEEQLAIGGKYYQSGGLIVSISSDPITGDPAIVPTNISTLTRELSVVASWVKFDKRSGEWGPSDPPPRHTSVLFDSKVFRFLLPLSGVARQPYFRDIGGELVLEPGYDGISKRFGVFNPKEFPLGKTTIEAAKEALVILRQLLGEFSFVNPIDEAAAVSAIFTAAVRVSLNVAPGYHIHASVIASGKSYLCELITAFSGPGFSEKISYPKSSEEATKVTLALLMRNPACIEYDDMDGDWLPHGVIKRMFTSEKITERILGYSKTATVSTRSLILGSGNNVGPTRDLSRRVVTIHLDPRVETPATRVYRGNPVAEVRANRGAYVMAVITIIQAWREAGMPVANVDSIASYDGQWSEYCRHPLIWLGLPDPARVLIEQVTHDPDRDILNGLLTTWFEVFGSVPTTVRKAVDRVKYAQPDLYDAMREFPIEERGEINNSKFGWVLKKNANRIVNGLEFRRAEADGRTAWQVVRVIPLES
ncbi:MAG: hypothetical protein DRP47_11500 [Candidatus Zixiibacteriota bacterium]|nr:MAG: hypothetical protein DRP47_11500 [candidate division Zixibacteria bacterium]